MPHPAWLGDGFAAAIVVVGIYCLTRLLAFAPLGRQTHVDVNIGHVLMAVAMVGMLVPGWRTLPDGVWAATFLLIGLWFFARAGLDLWRRGMARVAGPEGVHVRHYAVHGVMAFSMVYMDLVAGSTPDRSGGGMAMGSGAGAPALTLLFMVVLLASAVWQLNGIDRLVAVPPAVPVPPAVALAASALAAPATGASTTVHAGPARPSTAERPWLAPRLEVACHVAMCLAMAYMLVLVV